MNLASMAQDHASFIFGSRVERLIGVTQLDKKVEVLDLHGLVSQRLSLRDVLLTYFKTQEGATVIGSIHQGGMEEPFVIVQNSAEIESLLMRLNHQLPAFLMYYLQEKGLPEKFVVDLLRKSCDPVLFSAAFECKWDEKDQVITRPDEEELRKKREEEEKANQWYRDIVNIHMVTSQKSPPKKAYVAPEARYDLDADRSVTTINVHKKKHTKVTRAKAKKTAQSAGEGDSSGDDSSDSDSASDNASNKPFSKVGFGKKTVKTIKVDSSSSSEEESSAASDSVSQNSEEKGSGG
jgi:hypothetical protein